MLQEALNMVKEPSSVIKKNERKLKERLQQVTMQPEEKKKAIEAIHQQIARVPDRKPIGVGPLFRNGQEVKEESMAVRKMRDQLK